MRQRVAIESPFNPPAGGVAPYSVAETLRQNLVYARLCLLDSLRRGEAPITSHLLYTQVWAETPELREAGIAAGLEWYRSTDSAVHYCDLGVSTGMTRARSWASVNYIEVEDRYLFAGCPDVRAMLAAMTLDDFPALVIARAAEGVTT